MRTSCRIALAGLLLFCLTAAEAQIQTGDLLSGTSEKTMNTNYYFARPNELTIIVNVVGFVQRPGRYEIASTIDLMNLISLAGGPTPDGALSKVKIIRFLKEGEKNIRQDTQQAQINLSVFLKEKPKLTRREIQLNLDNLSIMRAEDLQLMPGDVVIVDQTAWSVVRDAFGVVVSVAVLTTAIMQIITSTR
jgi:hypothetical protein